MKNNFQKFSVLFSLYVAQAIPMSFFSTIVPVIMRQENYSLESIAMLQLLKLPWIAKFLWAPVIDRNSNTTSDYRKWIFISELFYAIIIFSIGFLSLQFDFTLIIILVIIAFVASATQDIATDAYAILLLEKSERGFGNSMQSAGSFVGTLVGSGFLLVLYHYYGWKLLLFGLSIFVLIAVIPLYFFKKNGQIEKKERSKASLKDVGSFFKQKKILGHILLLLTFYSGIIGILTMLKPYLVDIGFNARDIGFVVGIIGTSVGALSALAAGWIVKRYDRVKVYMMFLSVSLFISLFFVCITFQPVHSSFIYFGIVVLWMAYGLSTVVIYTSAMDRVRPGKEGTDFTLQIVLTHLGSIIIATQSGRIADALGYRGLFYIEVGLVMLTFMIILIFRNHLYENEKPKEIAEQV
ncbi:MAG: MFS transporter [Candidatus Kapabacteria bacterium]|nr:MFS transporter [Ignavibacteriota bacterium]MCW5885501.1 MFS transporter [Candidatus Kapabacteria bacterium]